MNDIVDQEVPQFIKNEHYVPSPMLMREVFLPKPLQKLCNGLKSVNIRAANFAHIVRALESMFGAKVKRFIMENAWQIRFGSNRSDYISQEDVHNLGTHTKVHMYFRVMGAGRGVQMIVGVVLIVVGVVISGMTFGGAAPIGGALISMGIGLLTSALLTPKAAAMREVPDERASFLFDSPTNVTEQGGAVPLAYGRSMVGSVVLTVGLDTEQIQSYDSPLGKNYAPDSLFGIITA